MSSIRYSVDCQPSPPYPFKEDNRDRLAKIQQKLQTITHQRHVQLKSDAQENITKRVLQLQTKTTEDIKDMENAFYGLKQQLCQLKMKEAERTKRCDLAMKNRSIDIAELHKKIMSSISFENKERKDHDSALMRNIDDKVGSVAREMAEVQRKRIAEINGVENNLQRELPGTHLAIQTTCTQVENKLQKLHRDVRGEVGVLRQNIDKEQQDREQGYKRVMLMLGSVMDEIKKDLEAERKEHKDSKVRLMALFESASEKLTQYQ